MLNSNDRERKVLLIQNEAVYQHSNLPVAAPQHWKQRCLRSRCHDRQNPWSSEELLRAFSPRTRAKTEAISLLVQMPVHGAMLAEMTFEGCLCKGVFGQNSSKHQTKK